MKEKALNYICLMRKANAIQIGENDTGTAIRSNQAKLVVLAADASDNARHRAEGFVHGRNVPFIVSPFTKNEISQAVGKNGCSMAAICDIGFADSFIRCLCAISPGEYGSTAENIANALVEAKTHRQDKAHRKNMSTGKRRKN